MVFWKRKLNLKEEIVGKNIILEKVNNNECVLYDIWVNNKKWNIGNIKIDLLSNEISVSEIKYDIEAIDLIIHNVGLNYFFIRIKRGDIEKIKLLKEKGFLEKDDKKSRKYVKYEYKK